jgi:hypothetical protein
MREMLPSLAMGFQWMRATRTFELNGARVCHLRVRVAFPSLSVQSLREGLGVRILSGINISNMAIFIIETRG